MPWGSDGLSLYLMRRDRSAQPGLNDFMGHDAGLIRGLASGMPLNLCLAGPRQTSRFERRLPYAMTKCPTN